MLHFSVMYRPRPWTKGGINIYIFISFLISSLLILKTIFGVQKFQPPPPDKKLVGILKNHLINLLIAD